MDKIDTSKCEFYSDIDKNCYKQKSMCDGYNKCEFYKTCTYKELQQYKKLCTQKTVDNFDLIKKIGT